LSIDQTRHTLSLDVAGIDPKLFAAHWLHIMQTWKAAKKPSVCMHHMNSDCTLQHNNTKGKKSTPNDRILVKQRGELYHIHDAAAGQAGQGPSAHAESLWLASAQHTSPDVNTAFRVQVSTRTSGPEHMIQPHNSRKMGQKGRWGKWGGWGQQARRKDEKDQEAMCCWRLAWAVSHEAEGQSAWGVRRESWSLWGDAAASPFAQQVKKDKTEVALEISHLVQNGQAVIQQLGDVAGMA